MPNALRRSFVSSRFAPSKLRFPQSVPLLRFHREMFALCRWNMLKLFDAITKWIEHACGNVNILHPQLSATCQIHFRYGIKHGSDWALRQIHRMAPNTNGALGETAQFAQTNHLFLFTVEIAWMFCSAQRWLRVCECELEETVDTAPSCYCRCHRHTRIWIATENNRHETLLRTCCGGFVFVFGVSGANAAVVTMAEWWRPDRDCSICI